MQINHLKHRSEVATFYFDIMKMNTMSPICVSCKEVARRLLYTQQ